MLIANFESGVHKLVEEISASYWEIFKKEIDSFTHLSKKGKELNEINDNIEYAYARGKISEQHYKLLSMKIRSSVNTNKNKNE
jgi:hypothetical protein